MEYDYIICCGDSFTEGCKNVLNITEADTWPGILGKELDVPWANLADGGASNYEIALQPVTQMHKWTNDTAPKKPLFIFNFTVDHRIPYYDYQLGELTSFYTTLPEEIDNADLQPDEKSQLMAQLRLGMLQAPIDYMDISATYNTTVDAFVYQTWQAIKVANNYKNLYADATVIWGFIHSYLDNESINTKTCMVTGQPYTINWPHSDSCFNNHMEGTKPLQHLTSDPAFWLTKHDSHPNPDGFRKYVEFFKQLIDK